MFPKNFLQEFPTRFSRKIFSQEFPARISHKIFPQDFPELDPDWLAPHHPIPNAKFLPITAFLKLAFSPPPCPARFSCKIFPSWILIGWLPITLFQMARCPHYPFPKSHGNPKSMNKLTLNKPAKFSAEFPTKNAFLKPILNQFSHMTHQIKAWNLLYKIKIFL